MARCGSHRPRTSPCRSSWGDAMTIKIRHLARQKDSRIWTWSVWLDGEDETLDRVESVVYQLHSTFRNPIREVSDRAKNFELSSSGWGQFMIYLAIRFKDGTQEQREHWLSFGENEGVYRNAMPEVDDEASPSPKAFLSYSIVDSARASALREALEEKGVEVLDQNDVNPGSDWTLAVDEMINKADFAVSIETGTASTWQASEANRMRDRNVPLISVVADGGADDPIQNLKVSLGGGVDQQFARLMPSSIKLK